MMDCCQQDNFFWSVMIPTYNPKPHYLEQTLQSVMQQYSSDMQIEVVDNCSTQINVEEIVRTIGQGKIAFHRQPNNIGMIPNFSSCIQRAHGEWIHILCADDFVLPGFYSSIKEALGLDKGKNIGAGFCRHYHINGDGKPFSLSDAERDTPGILDNFLERIAVMQRIQFVSIVVRSSVYEKLGGFCQEAGSAFDWEIWKRIATHYSIWYEPQPLACFRIHSGSESTYLTQSGKNIEDIRQAIEISKSYLPQAIAEELSNCAKEHFAIQALILAHLNLLNNNVICGIALMREGLKFTNSLKVANFFISRFQSIETYLSENIINNLSDQQRSKLINTLEIAHSLLTMNHIPSIVVRILKHLKYSQVKRIRLTEEVKTFHNPAQINTESEFAKSILFPEITSPTTLKQIKIIIDGIFFQLNNTSGIARIWKTLLEEWTNDEFAKKIVVLDRAGTAPKISGICYITVPPYDYYNTDADRIMLQKICDAEKADMFVSTYYTTPLSTPSVFMAYDMVPEMTGANLATPMWKEKYYGVYHASYYVAISENTANDLIWFFPYISRDSVAIAYCGIEKNFEPVKPDEISIFKSRYGISKPYFLLVGERLGLDGYKNAILFFKAFSILDNKHEFEIVCVGGTNSLEPVFVPYASGVNIHLLKLSDDELRCAYSGAASLVYPSKYEGFGLPIAEAMACGCPIITCRNASIPEVAGNAVVYVNDSDANELVNALKLVQIPQNRKLLIEAGFEQVKKFSWRKMADIVSSTLLSLGEKLSMGKISTESLYISHLKQNIKGCGQNPSEQRGVEYLRQERRRIAEMLLNTPKEKIEGLYQTYVGDAYNLLLTSGLQTVQPTMEDQSVVAKIMPSIQNSGVESVLTTAYRPLIERNVPLIGSERILVSNIVSTLQNGNNPSHLLQYLLAALLFFQIDIRKVKEKA